MKSITQDNHQMESLNQKIATFFEQYAIGKLLRTASQGFRPCASEVCLRIPHADYRLVGWQHIPARQLLPAFDGKCQKPHQ